MQGNCSAQKSPNGSKQVSEGVKPPPAHQVSAPPGLTTSRNTKRALGAHTMGSAGVLLALFTLAAASIQGLVQAQGAFSFEFPDEDGCRTPFNEPGSCLELARCPALQSVRDFNFLRRYICGFSRNVPLLCCPGGGQQRPPTRQPPTRQPPTRQPPTRRPPTRQPPTRQPPTRRPPTQGPPTRDNSDLFEGPRIANYPRFLPSACGLTNVSVSRIVGGRESEPGAWPWMAAIYINSGGVNSAACGGALVTDRHVVTAAHCVVVGHRATNLPASSFTIRLGDHNLVRSDDHVMPVDVPVVKVERHADFVARTFKNDVAVLTMERPVTFNKFVRPVCLPYGDDFKTRDLNGYHAFVTGWGTTAFNGESSDVLKEAQIKIWDEDTCKKAFVKEVPISSVYLCAGDGNGRQDSCQGDSGGPLVLPDEGRFFLIGVVSFGKRCATPGYPGVYTRLTEFLPWLSERLQMLLWLLVAALVAVGNATNSSAGRLGESNCRTPDGRDGHCILASQCTSLSNLSRTELFSFVCGYRRRQAKLCCAPEPEAVANSTDAVTLQAITDGAPTPPSTPVPTDTPLPIDSHSALPSSCGIARVIESRVVGGRVADVGAWPWMAAIYEKTEGAEPAMICGGALVTDRHVLTAATCLSRDTGGKQPTAQMLTVRLGDHDLNSTNDQTAPVDVQVSDLVRHPDYAQSTYTNDIALLVLSEPVTWSRFVQPVCLPFGPLASETLEGRNAFIIGWGATKFGYDGSSELRQAQIPIWTEDDCKKAYQRYLVITKEQLCAGDNRGESDACQGDSGGPLLLPYEGRYYVVGIISWGKGCAIPGFPGVYTRVSAYLDWLRNELGAAQ
ncbi:transmembrane protease serine 9-like [Amblyomma americanum]